MFTGTIESSAGNLSRYFRIKKILKKLFITLSITSVIYTILISPIFFMYPKIDEPVKYSFDRSYFTGIADTLRGDCKRKVQNFMLACPFPTREVHLSSDHTIVEIQMYGKWYGFDPSYNIFFNNNNIIQVSFDVSRGYIPRYLKNYKYLNSLKDVKYYHSYYFIFLKYICPFYDDVMKVYYSIM